MPAACPRIRKFSTSVNRNIHFAKCLDGRDTYDRVNLPPSCIRVLLFLVMVIYSEEPVPPATLNTPFFSRTASSIIAAIAPALIRAPTMGRITIAYFFGI